MIDERAYNIGQSRIYVIVTYIFSMHDPIDFGIRIPFVSLPVTKFLLNNISVSRNLHDFFLLNILTLEEKGREGRGRGGGGGLCLLPLFACACRWW